MNDVSTAKPLQGIDHVREQFHNLHEFVAAARAKLDRNVWDYLIGGAETETTLRRNRLGARLARLPPARAARRQRHRHQRDVPRPEDSRCRWCSRRSAASSASIRRPAPPSPTPPARSAAAMFRARSASPTSRRPRSRSPERPEDLPALRARRRGLGRGDLRPRGRGRLRRALPHRRHRTTTAAASATSPSATHAASSARSGRARAIRTRSTGPRSTSCKKNYKLPLVIKGIATAEDAELAVEHGVDVIYVSNHGGRQLDHGRGTIDVLPEVVAAVKGRAEIIVDGGFCRGTDVVKAIALGADMVAHRPALCLRHGGRGPRRHLPRAGAARRTR